MGQDGTGRVLVTVAHPDDETFGTGSLLAHATARGWTSTVWCATRGEAGTPASGSGLQAEDLPRVREAELRGAAAMLGVAEVVLREWRDSGMEGAPTQGTLCAATLDEVADDVAGVIDRLRPDVVVTLDGSDGHRDHVHVRESTLLAVDRADHHVARVYLHCLPQVLMRRWVDLLQAQQPDSAHLALGELGTPEDLVTTVVDTAIHLELREAAMAHHRSQTSPYEVMPPDLRREFLTTDRLRRLRPAWDDGPRETELFTAPAPA